MKESYTYHGHSIDLQLEGRAYAPIRWTYFIDDSYCIQGTADALPVESVRASTLALAQRSIEKLDSMRSVGGGQDSRPTGPRVAFAGGVARRAMRVGALPSA